MIPDNVEKIIMTKEDYDRNVEQLLLDKCNAELEIQRLNNIIDELEKCVNDTENWYIDFVHSYIEKEPFIKVAILKENLKELKEGK